jgi:hypothetical protein
MGRSGDQHVEGRLSEDRVRLPQLKHAMVMDRKNKMTAHTVWPDTGTLTTIASVTMAFSASMLFFRMQREHTMQGKGEPNWIPWADCLLIAAGVVSLLLVILPIVAIPPDLVIYRVVPPAGCGVSSVLVLGYTPAILAHYRLIMRGGRVGPRQNPEPSERLLVVVAVALAVLCGLWVAFLHVVC